MGIVLSGVFLTNSVEKHDNMQIIKGLLLVESTIKIAGPLHPASIRRVEYAGTGYPKGIGKAAVLAALKEDPDASAKEISNRCGVSERYVRQLKKKESIN